ncbi:MAG: ATP synthase F1 subunit epsilon [Acidimicrobiia bacterium]
MAGNLEVVVVSPARPIYEGSAEWVTLPVWSRVGGEEGLYGSAEPAELAVGQIGILPQHAPLVAALGSGILRIGREGGRVARFAVRGGFVRVGDDKVTVLVDSAVSEGDANRAEAQRDLDETLEALRSPATDEEFAELLDRRAWDESRIKLAGS